MIPLPAKIKTSMTRILRVCFALIFAGFLLAGCNKNTPKYVAGKWLNAFYHADYETAMPMSTDLTRTQLEQFEQLSSYVNDSMKKDLKKLTVNVKDVKEKGDTAIATYTVSDNNKEQTIVLLKQNGKWLVAFSKNDSFKPSDFKDEPMPAVDSAAATVAPADTNSVDTVNKD